MEKSCVVFVDDDDEDLEFIKAAAEAIKLDREIKYFKTGDQLINYLEETPHSPFLIVSDVFLLGETGFEIKQRVATDENLKYKSVPFIFWSTAASEKQIQKAYDLPAQGFFFKPGDFLLLCDTLTTIINYWEKSQHPKTVA